MKKINLAISGCLGRMGQQLIKSSKNNLKQQELFKDLRKEVNIGDNGTQKYKIKKGINKGKVI